MLTTRRRFASSRRCRASSSPASMRCARATSSSAVRRGTCPISFKYIRTGSSSEIPSGTERSISTSSSLSGPSSSAASPAAATSSTISTPSSLKRWYISSISSGDISCFCSASMSSPKSSAPPFFLPLASSRSMMSVLGAFFCSVPSGIGLSSCRCWVGSPTLRVKISL